MEKFANQFFRIIIVLSFSLFIGVTSACQTELTRRKYGPQLWLNNTATKKFKPSGINVYKFEFKKTLPLVLHTCFVKFFYNYLIDQTESFANIVEHMESFS